MQCRHFCMQHTCIYRDIFCCLRLLKRLTVLQRVCINKAGKYCLLQMSELCTSSNLSVRTVDTIFSTWVPVLVAIVAASDAYDTYLFDYCARKSFQRKSETPGTDPTYGMSASNTKTMNLKATVESIESWYIRRSPIVIIVFLRSRGGGGGRGCFQLGRRRGNGGT
jgi:hypothetical protein